MWRRLSPAQSILAFFVLSILVGCALLSLPWAIASPQPQGFLVNLFTAASAVCVTGLTVVPTGEYYTLFGQIIILILIQIGALGYVTFVTSAGILLGKLPIKERLAIKEIIDPSTFEGLLTLLKRIIKITFVVEFIGAVILAILFSRYFDLISSIYYGVFHSVSAFANAGFAVFPDSFEGFRTDIPIIVTLSLLIVLGGIGFLVITELVSFKDVKNLSLHTKMTLLMTAGLILFGAVLIFIFEQGKSSSFYGMSVGERIGVSIFQSITARTAGFNTVPIGGLRQITLFVLIVLMFIGASPGGTGGGIKTTTFGVVFLWLVAFVRGKECVNIFSRKIPREVINRAIVFCMLGIFVISVMVLPVLFFQKDIPFINGFFEVVSAYGTVGLSTGITSSLGAPSRIIIILTMFIGRVGPLTLLMSAVGRKEKDLIQYSEERVLVG